MENSLGTTTLDKEIKDNISFIVFLVDIINLI